MTPAEVLFDAMEAALRDARSQIEYLHIRSKPTASGNALISRIDVILAAIDKERNEKK